MNIPYIFFRGSDFYPIELPETEDVMEHVRCNPGTTKVINMLSDDVVFDDGTDAHEAD